MRIGTLEAFGIDERIIELWKDAGHKELLPIQQIAVRKGKVLEGKNAVIFSPTSSGKTFVGEMAAVRTARQNKRAIYLVPQKALAEEKFQEFKRKYGSFGIRVVISTRDRKEYDRDIYRGQFHIAVIVFEKMQSLMVASPALLRNVGLVVADELQMIGDKTRGAGLEILLTKILIAQDKPQIIGLSAVLGNAQLLADWMGAELCEDRRRPVELRKGVLHNGTFHYYEHNSGKSGEEKLDGCSASRDRMNTLVSQVRLLAERGEQCLVFCKSRDECLKTASLIATGMNMKPADRTLDEMRYLEDSQGKDLLSSLLEHRVAYHNADLDWDQRDIIERWFREGEIMVVCSTTTLAMGINLPARNVFIDPERWDRDRMGTWGRVPISQAEYENTSGRAGRLGLEEEFGRAVIIACSDFETRTYLDTFVNGELGDVEPTLDNVPLAQHVLNLVASKICRDEREIRDILLSSYTGTLSWRGGEKEEAFSEKLRSGLEHCIEGGLIERRKKELVATRLGKLAAAKGIAVETAIAMAHFARDMKDVAVDLDPLEILWSLSGTENGEAIHFNLSTLEFRSGEYPVILSETVTALPKVCRQRVMASLDDLAASYEGIKRLKKTLLLHDWVMGEPTREIETRFHCFSGSVSGLSGEFAWLAETLSAVSKAVEWPEKSVANLAALAQQLIYGVPSAGLKLASIRVRGLGRGRIVALIKEDLKDLEKVVQEPIEKLRKLITKPVADRLRRRAAELLEAEGIRPEDQQGSYDEVTGETPESAEYKEWPEDYPPSDGLGISYQSDVYIHLDGRAQKRRHRVRLNDQEVWLTEQSFDAALKLALAATRTDLGWLSYDHLGSIDNYHQVIRRLKKDLEVSGIDADKLVENNRAKQYRFSVPPSNITLNKPMIRRHVTGADKLFDAAELL